MCVKKILCGLLLSTFHMLHSQPVTTVTLPDELHKAYEFSGIAIQDDVMFLVSEKCTTLFEVNLNTKVVKPSLLAEHFAGKNVQIEGLAFFHDHLFMVDEEKSWIYAYNPGTHKTKTVAVKGNANLDQYGSSDEYGLEGIAFAEPNTCFILREKTPDNKSIIYRFTVSETADSFKLQYEGSVSINQANTYRRYTDLYFDADKSRLLCLGTRFIKNDTLNNKYWVDAIPFTGGKLVMENKTSALCISQPIKELITKEKGMPKKSSTNLEGLALYKNEFYIISDNMRQKYCDPKNPDAEKTLLLKAKLINQH